MERGEELQEKLEGVKQEHAKALYGLPKRHKEVLATFLTYSYYDALDILDTDREELEALRNTSKKFNKEFLKAIGLTEKQDKFVLSFAAMACNVSSTCEAVGIRRPTFNSWRKNNDLFAALIAEEEESMLDLAESMLYKNIQDGKESSLFFVLKTKGKARGYIERTESDVTVKGGLDLVNKRMSDDERDARIKELEERLKQ